MSVLLAMSLGLLWGFAGYTLRKRTKLSVVAVSSWLTLVAALVLPRFFHEGYLFALICTAVSYVVMSSSNRLEKLWETLVVCLICTLLVYFGQDVLVGIGGRLGTLAALSALIFIVPKVHFGLLKARRR
ncbi:MAG: hypothetical protein GX979_09170 [Firmicutes bacterium]|nr:hypothetical protein [Bacillota bacterium]